MMRRDHQIGDGDWHIVFVLYRHLGFAVWIQALYDPLLPYFGEPPGQAMRKIDRSWHQLGIHSVETSFLGRITEHHALVASTLLFKQPLACRDTLGNVRTLRFQIDVDLACVSTKTNAIHRITDLTDRLAGNRRNIESLQDHITDLAGDHCEIF